MLLKDLNYHVDLANTNFLGNPHLISAHASPHFHTLQFYIDVFGQYMSLTFSDCMSIDFFSYDSLVRPADLLLADHPEYQTHYFSNHILISHPPDDEGITTFFLSFQYMELSIACRQLETELLDQLPDQYTLKINKVQTVSRQNLDTLRQEIEPYFTFPITSYFWYDTLDTLTLSFSHTPRPLTLSLAHCQKLIFRRRNQPHQSFNLSETYYTKENRSYTCLHIDNQEFSLSCCFQQLALGELVTS